MKLVIKGVPEDSFTINVGKSKDIIALQYNVHFSQGVDTELETPRREADSRGRDTPERSRPHSGDERVNPAA
ncbi:hypothetical protein COCON_G00138130 [Conger conger]|uniref:Galectin domain-containing protein n=1 Tax=Conger conger TaxID=82655 RepID=A0A9Q1DFM4_CONCO|nr:hypothetical protein COCON_G00138130 [Conger conger]